jgi:hypothetical protein
VVENCTQPKPYNVARDKMAGYKKSVQNAALTIHEEAILLVNN